MEINSGITPTFGTSISARCPEDALGFQSQPSIVDPTTQRHFRPKKKPGRLLGGETLESFPPGAPLLTLCSPSPPTVTGVTVPGDDDDRHRGMSLQLLFPSFLLFFPPCWSRSMRGGGPVVSPFAGRAAPLAVSAPPSNGEAVVPFAPEGVMFFVRAPNWCARDQEELARPRRRRTFAGEPKAQSGEFLFPFAFFFSLCLAFRVLRGG